MGQLFIVASGKIFGHPQGPNLCSTLGKGIETQILYCEARIVVFHTLYCRACGAETANSKGSGKKENQFCERWRAERGKEEKGEL